MTETGARPGIGVSARRVVAHVRSLARLEQELARTELQRKGASLGAGAALVIGAAILSLFAIGLGLATAVALVALALDVWLALLIVFVGTLLVVVALLLVARQRFRAGANLKPVQALEEARLTKAALRGDRDG